MYNLQQKTILITGAGDGIGRALSLACAEHGATVILLDKNVKRLETLYDEIMDNEYPEPAIYPLDLMGASPTDYGDMAATLQHEFGSLHGLVHNAADIGSLTPLEHYDIKTWFKLMQINLNAPFIMTKACIPLLRTAEHATLLFTLADQGLTGKAYWGAYGVTKFGLNGLMQTWADELENSNIHVAGINPGDVATRLYKAAYPARDLHQIPRPDAIVDDYLQLLAEPEQSSYGQVMQATVAAEE